MVNYTHTNFDQKINVSGTNMDYEDFMQVRFQIVW